MAVITTLTPVIGSHSSRSKHPSFFCLTHITELVAPLNEPYNINLNADAKAVEQEIWDKNKLKAYMMGCACWGKPSIDIDHAGGSVTFASNVFGSLASPVTSILSAGAVPVAVTLQSSPRCPTSLFIGYVPFYYHAYSTNRPQLSMSHMISIRMQTPSLWNKRSGTKISSKLIWWVVPAEANHSLTSIMLKGVLLLHQMSLAVQHPLLHPPCLLGQFLWPSPFNHPLTTPTCTFSFTTVHILQITYFISSILHTMYISYM